MRAGKSAGDRVWLLDEARGLFILLMVLYHLAYDLVYIFGVNIPVFHWTWMDVLQLLIAGLFLFISGIVSRYSRSNFRRGAVCFGCGMLMTLGTFLFLPQQKVLFGVLHALGACMLLFALIRPLLDKIPPAVGLVACAVLFLVTFNIQDGYLGMGPWTFPLPDSLYQSPYLFFLGFPNGAFWSSDYFPLLPWVFWFLSGSFAGVYLRQRRCPEWVYRPHCRPLAVVGRNTLWIYLLHQPVLYGVLLLIFR